MANSELFLHWGNLIQTLDFHVKAVIPGSFFVFDGKLHFAIAIRYLFTLKDVEKQKNVGHCNVSQTTEIRR